MPPNQLHRRLSASAVSLWLCLLCCILAQLTSLVQATKLVQLQLVFRHGVRNPLKVFPNDPYQSRYKQSDGLLGELTPIGVEQMRELGQFVRKHYGEQQLLPSGFEPKTVWAYSTDTDRTLVSGQTFLRALFPPVNGSEPAETPLHSMPKKTDPLKPTSYACPARDRLIDGALSGPAFHAEESVAREFLARLGQATGQSPFRLSDAWSLGSNAQMWVGMRLRLPPWLSFNDYQRLQVMRVRKYEMMFGSRPVQKFCGGPLLSRMLDGARARLIDSPTRLLVYSAHDTTIMSLVSALGIPLGDLGFVPPPAALLAMEVYSDSTVRLVYRNSTLRRPRLLHPAACGSAADCSIDRLSAASADLVSVNLMGECQLASLSHKPLWGVAQVVLFGLFLLACAVCLFVLLVCRRRKHSRGGSRLLDNDDDYGEGKEKQRKKILGLLASRRKEKDGGNAAARNGDYAYTPLINSAAHDGEDDSI